MKKVFNKKKVLITGNTGFKGSWLSLWMHSLGAKVIGISNGYPTRPSNFQDLNLNNKIDSRKIDIRNYNKLKKIILKFQPDFVFHLAAQAIVKKSFENPRHTWETNTLGTINVIDSLRSMKKKVIAVIITSDKVYKNLEVARGYNEQDVLQGEDAYSSSKSAADIATQSYIKTILRNNKNIKVSIARAGNVIGGGDWAPGRIVPDCMREWSLNKTVEIRNPKSTRPWQFVLDVLFGYMTLAKNLKVKKNLNGEAFNFGPRIEKKRDVISVVEEMKKVWKNGKWLIKKNKKFQESNLLQLNSNKAKKKLKWECKLNLKQSINFTAEWYKQYFKNKKEIVEFSLSQIKKFESLKK